MADHMHWAALFLSAFVAFICDCKPLDGYKFPVYTTELCPRNQTEWMERSSAINCTESNGYLCLPSEDLNELLEFCYFEYQIPIAKGLCMFLRKRDSFIDAYNCRNFVEGCPNSTYRIYEVNKYRSCVSIGNSCFLAEPACIRTTGTYHLSTTPYRTASIEETNNTMHEFIPFQERNDVVWILTFLGVAIGALIIIPVNMFYRKMKRKDTREKKERKGLIDEKCGQTDANKSQESKPIGRERDSYRLEDEKEKEKYVYFWQKHSVFSQWYPCTFVIDGIKYNCAEQFIMYKKAEIMGDEETAKAIMTLDDPRKIKNRGRYVKNFNRDIWGRCSQEIVKRGNMEKFSQNEELKQQLLWTHPKTLVEASPNDQIWGIGLSEHDPKAWNKLTWRGKNLLGEILTTVRERLRRDIENAGPYGDSNDLDL